MRTFTDPLGRFIICDLKILTVAIIYAPNEDNPTFFKDFFVYLLTFQCEDIITGGDFRQLCL